uniref:UDP-N-acetylglucosamine diphosphorylase n=1 Tax=Meloidogyne incognita TaxID=6306 RepID=A0A914L313_MELIC
MGIRDHLLTQPKLLNYLNSLEEQKKDEFAEYLLKFDFDYLAEAFKSSQNSTLPALEDISPIGPENFVDRSELTDIELNRLFNLGLKAVSEGKVAALVLAGGQASRLGSDHPKGVLPLGTGLHSKTDSLLFIQAAQIRYLEDMAKKKFPSSNKSTITWLIMTSRSTDSDTRAHLKDVIEETGLCSDQVIIFTQDELPAFSLDGEALLAEPYRLVTSPDGHGGLYNAISPFLPLLEQKGLEFIQVYNVDNILCKVPDLYMVGSAIEQKADCVAKVIEKINPSEAVGHVCLEKGKVRVLEYSEISFELAEARDADGKLILCAGSISIHLLSLNFLRIACLPENIKLMPLHAARKQINYLETGKDSGDYLKRKETTAIKLERFVFDAFHHSKNFLVWQVLASEEFSPLKNADSAGKDCLKTCLADFNGINGKWIKEACLNILEKKKI